MAAGENPPVAPEAPPTRRASRVSAAVGGGVAGAAVSTGLFSMLGVAKLLADPNANGFVYPLVVLCLVAIFSLVAALFNIDVSINQRRIIYIGMAAFFGIAVLGALELLYEEHYTPDILVTQRFHPDTLVGRGLKIGSDPASSIVVRLEYEPPGSGKKGDGKNEYTIYNNEDIKVHKGETIEWQIDGLENVSRYYEQQIQKQALDRFKVSFKVCREVPRTCHDLGIDDSGPSFLLGDLSP